MSPAEETTLVGPLTQEPVGPYIAGESHFSQEAESVRNYWLQVDAAKAAPTRATLDMDHTVNTFASVAIATTSIVLALIFFIGR